jgi:hypothetical protein
MVENRPKATRIVTPGDLVEDEYVECISGRRVGLYRGWVTTVSDSRKSCKVRNELDQEEVIEFRMNSLRSVGGPPVMASDDDDSNVAQAEIVTTVVDNIETVDWRYAASLAQQHQLATAAASRPTSCTPKQVEQELSSHRLASLLNSDLAMAGHLSAFCLAMARHGFGPSTSLTATFEREMLAAQHTVLAELRTGKPFADNRSVDRDSV